MSESEYVYDVTAADFEARVIDRSREVAVLVDFWAAWCAPCRVLSPILTRLAVDLDGRLMVAKVDSDAEQRLALDYGVRGLPTCKLFRDGAVIDEFVGLQPESAIRAIVEPHLPRDSDRLRAQAQSASRESAIDMLEQALKHDPDNLRIHPELAELLIDAGHYDRAQVVLHELPPGRQEDADVVPLLARLRYARAVENAPDTPALEAALAADPGNSEARYQLGARHAVAGRFEPALDTFLDLVRRDRQYGEDAGRRAMIDVFTLLGPEHPLVRRYRGLLSSALH